MTKINLRFEHGRLVFAVDGEEFYIEAADLLGLLDGQRVKQTFYDLDPAVIYVSFDNFDFIARFEALKEKGYSLAEIAEHESTTPERLEAWQTTRAGKIQQIKELNLSNFQAAVRGAKERIVNKRK